MNEMIRNKKRKKTFIKNDDYFKWHEENKDKVNIISVDTARTKIKLEYENKEVESEQRRTN